MFVELGGGLKPHPRADVHLDLDTGIDVSLERWPVDTGSADVVYSSHFLEHIYKGTPIITVFNEAARVLKPGGRFINVMPIIGYHSQPVNEWMPWADPTHVQFWWMPQSVQYFTREIGADAEYGLGNNQWEPLGPPIPEGEASRELAMLERGHGHAMYESFWSVRGGWECVFSIVKYR
jgi:SAM-dependent methyltransferase